jgi:hypothetical protein
MKNEACPIRSGASEIVVERQRGHKVDYKEILKRSQRYNEYLLPTARVAGVFLILMSLLRYIFYFLSRQEFEFVYASSILHAFLVGVRFDLLVIGFILIPAVTIFPALFLTKLKEPVLKKILKLYLSLMWGLVVLSSFVSLPLYLLKGRHFRWKEDSFVWLSLDVTTAVLVCIIFLLVILVGLKTIRNQKFDRNLPFLKGAWHLLAVLIVALAARGTVSAHHLEKADSEISPWENLNELVINSIWALDK